MQVLVTGGAGFIGGHLAEQFAADGHDVVVLDNFEPYYDLGIKEHNVEAARDAAKANGATYKLIDGSITDDDQVDTLVSEADVIYHQAAQAGVRKSVEQPAKVNAYNVDGTVTLLEAARRHDVERVVLASSSSVYGKPEYLPYDEAHPTTPVSPYGVSKLAAEQYARVYSEVYGLPTVGLRYFTVYGPRMRPNMAMTNFVSRCLHGESPVIYGDGTQTRDFTYVADIKRVNAQLLNDDSADGEILNIGSTDTIDIQTLAEVVRDEIDPSLDIEYTDPREGDAEHTHADISKANALLGYEPTVDIREGVSAFIDWYRENKAWYDPLVRGS
ncbi:GalE family epimerase/dehydratase [Natronomonas pharaonis DSM 2160]|uniref:GalE family epimerase/dehydratase n=1 Tax=Natronomonas pharaonis (strain ATCC 35678 / DSM 2160 / CIP 103997 / JCM 8858 / NBRC 14720 / NCIMB 2260 / Gabara) TaxID=348780 RepID=A0A1U7EYW0_NATPD|nr:GDP-mannose 4,6-dehydratase [Natronomonas pharaonis]CAI50422.1 GalE family epimerase/dehydratase [Natronomonas pharaonis DSM 2160]